MAYDFSLAYLTVFDLPPNEAAQVAADCGYAYLGMRMLPSGSEGAYPIMTDDKLLRETKAVLDDTGVELADIEIIRLNDRFNAQDTKAFLERGAFLGAKNVLVAGDDPEEQRLTENFAAFCEIANQYSMTADLEFMPWTKVPDIHAANRIVQAANQPNGGVLIDALHYHRADTRPSDVLSVEPERIHYVQFCDAPAKFDPSTEQLIYIAREARLPPGEGEIDLKALLNAIPDDIVLSIEVPNFAWAKTTPPAQRALSVLEGMKKLIAEA
ncbi:MAG: sugar phosphate isomerase/epimerase family protein [Pontibacterium sp.]